MDLSRESLVELALDSAAAGADGPPAGLWQRVTDVTTKAPPGTGAPTRHPGWARPEVAGIAPLDAFADTAAEFGQLLDSLDAGDWERRTRVEGARVRQLAEHLVGMERYLLGQLGRRDALVADRREDHWAVTRAASADLSGETDEAVARAWWHSLLEVIGACGELGPDQPVRYHHLAGTVRTLCVSRTFELWAHGDDVRQAVGRPLDLLDEPRLSLMVRDLMDALPVGTLLTEQPRPGCTARFELGGPGGGTFDVALAFGEAPGDPDIVVRTDTIGLCRLAANRLRPDELGASIEGDRSLLAPVLAAAGAFAAD